MKTSLSFLALVTLLFSLAMAQIPQCAIPCIASAVANATTCGTRDLVCQCQASNKAAIQSAATACVLTDCGPANALDVVAAANSACSSALASASSSVSSTSAPEPISTILVTPSPPPISSPESSPAASSEPASPTTINWSTYPSSPTTSSVLSSSSTSCNTTATSTAPPVQVSAGAGAKMGLERAGSLFAVGMAVLVAL